MTDAMRYALKVIRQESYPHNGYLVRWPAKHPDDRLNRILVSTLTALRRLGKIKVLDYPVDDDRFIASGRLYRYKIYHLRPNDRI